MGGSMKPVTLLKRPAGLSTTPSPSGAAVLAGSAGSTGQMIPRRVPVELADRVAEAVRSAIDSALTRERIRMESTYRLRQEKLLRAMADILRGTLQRHVAAAAEREADALAKAVRNLAASSSLHLQESTDVGGGLSNSGDKKHAPPQTLQKQQAIQNRNKTGQVEHGDSGKRSEKRQDVEIDTIESVRTAFRNGFERELLGSIESSIREMLSEISSVTDSEIEAKIAAPSAETAHRVLRGAADQVRADTSELSVLVASASDTLFRGTRLNNGEIVDMNNDLEDGLRTGVDDDKMRTENGGYGSSLVDEEQIALEAVSKALSEGRIRDAMMEATGMSALVRARAVNGALDSGVAPEEVLGSGEVGEVDTGGRRDESEKDGALPFHALTELCAVLSSDLYDRTEARLAWLFEAVMCLEEAPRGEDDISEAKGEANGGVLGKNDVMLNVRLLETAVEKLREFASSSKQGGNADEKDEQEKRPKVTAADSKHAKVLVRALKSTIQKLQR